MNDLDLESLQHVHDWAEVRVNAYERRKRLAPLLEGMAQQMASVQAELIPDLTAPATAQFRRSVVALEKSADEFPIKIRAAEERLEQNLASARRRTTALRRWLESIS